jgi:hypothetical protein
MGGQSRLAVVIDGVPLTDDDEARALWTKFSQHMDEHQGDLAGFAKLCGYASVKPEARKGQAVLVIETRAQPPPQPQTSSRAPGPAPRANGTPKAPKKRSR